jgi:hypothetical protein
MKVIGLQGVVRGKKGHYDEPRYGATMPERQREPGLRRGDAEPALGFGFHLCLDLARDGLRCFRHRCLRPQDRRLACFHLNDHGPCSRRPEPGYLPTGTLS